MTESPDEKLTDDIDRASAAEMRATENAINAARRAARPQQSPRADGTYEVTECEDCEQEIGEQRLRVAIMNRLCVYCASAREKRR